MTHSRSIQRRAPLLGLALALGLLGQAAASESRIELRDGSVLRGELVSVGGGTYRIRSAALGEIELRESDVAAIRPLGEDGPAAPAPVAAAGVTDLAAIQRQLLEDPTTLQAILALQNDPQLQSALADPAFAQRILSGDLAGLRTDPRFLRLMENPAIQDILKRVPAQ